MLLRRYLFRSFAFIFGAAWATAGTLFLVIGLVIWASAADSVGYPFILFGLLFASIGWFLAFRGYRGAARAVELLRNGAVARGLVTGVAVDYNTRINRRHPRYFTFSFVAPEDGSVREGRSPNLPMAMEGQWKTGDTITVAYDSRNPALCAADIYGVRQI